MDTNPLEIYTILTSSSNPNSDLKLVASEFCEFFIPSIEYLKDLDPILSNKIYMNIIDQLQHVRSAEINVNSDCQLTEYSQRLLESFKRMLQTIFEQRDEPGRVIIEKLFLEEGFSFFSIFFNFSGDSGYVERSKLMEKIKNKFGENENKIMGAENYILSSIDENEIKNENENLSHIIDNESNFEVLSLSKKQVKKEKEKFVNEFVEEHKYPLDPGQENIEQPILRNVAFKFKILKDNCPDPLPLREIALKCRNVEYNQRRLNAVIMRIKEPKKCTFLIFNTGSVIATGLNQENYVKVITRVLFRKMERCLPEDFHKNLKLSEPYIFNVWLNAKLPPLSLIRFSKSDHMVYCSYEPELYSALIYRMLEYKCVFLIFSSGKILITGTNSSKNAIEAFSQLKNVLRQYETKYFQ